jgi:hypothetical protein
MHDGLRDGTITLTFRNWKRPQAKVGGRYRTGGDDLTVLRISFHREEASHRQPPLLDDDVVDVRLERLDRVSPVGPWTRATLDVIARRPAVRAADLAAELGRERLPFKADVRKLQRLGLTESLDVGYRLSARGRSYLDRR